VAAAGPDRSAAPGLSRGPPPQSRPGWDGFLAGACGSALERRIVWIRRPKADLTEVLVELPRGLLRVVMPLHHPASPYGVTVAVLWSPGSTDVPPAAGAEVLAVAASVAISFGNVRRDKFTPYRQTAGEGQEQAAR
jgi:hypothetical protein